RWSDNRDRRVCQNRKMVGGYYICLMVSYPRGSGHFSTDSGVFGTGNGSLQVLCREQGLSGRGFQDPFWVSVRPLWKCSACNVSQKSVHIFVDAASDHSGDCKEL